jgi:autotransporter-associated beta strand protein
MVAPMAFVPNSSSYNHWNPTMKNIIIQLCILVALALTALTATAQTNRFWSGTGVWDTTSMNWGIATGGPYNTAWASGDNATFEGTLGTVTLGSTPISVNKITFTTAYTTAGRGYTISGGTLNFVAGGSINQAVRATSPTAIIDHTITSAITGSPLVNIVDGSSYYGLTFAPTSGTVTLGICTVPTDGSGTPGDKAGLTLDGTTTGNSVSKVQFAKTPNNNPYGKLWKKGTGTWTVGSVDIGSVELSGGTLVVNGAMTTNYQGLVFTGGTLQGTGPIALKSGYSVTVPANGSLSPGTANGTLAITGTLDLSAVAAGTGTGKLLYDLATPATSDKIAVTGSVNIGTGVLRFSDFVFNNLGGMQAGVYTLITTTTGITGTLDPANLSGTIGGFAGTLQITGNNLEWATTGLETYILSTSPADGATNVLVEDLLTATFSKPVVLGSGNITLRNLTDSVDTVIPVGDSRISVSGSVLTIKPGSALLWNKNYAVRIDATAIVSTTGYNFAGIADDTTWNFSTLPSDPLLDALTALKSHITGAIPLSADQIEAHKLTIDAYKSRFGTVAADIAAAFDLVTTYDTVLGPLFVARGLPNRSAVTNDIHWTLYTVMQDIMDLTYTVANIANNQSLLNGFKFGSSASFPGSCAPPTDPNQTYTATINASNLAIAAWPTLADGPGTYARRPTGTYLAPGTFATVTVPPALVGAGYKIRVGAHTWDMSAHQPSIKRLDRVSVAYDITATNTTIASPLGGGIYIDVPWQANGGIVNVQVTGAVRSPYFSARSIQKTTPAQWLTERTNPVPWADFQTDKFMLNVPTSWISAMPDPTQLMADWDASVDAINDLMGRPRLSGKETLYLQVDISLPYTFYATGYPAVNNQAFVATGNYGGFKRDEYLVRGPQFFDGDLYTLCTQFHEKGHGFLFQKFSGELESSVNLLYVPVLYRNFGISLDKAFRSSLGYTNTYQTLDTTAMAWMTVFNFSPRKAPMATAEKAYQLKGHAKYVDIARLFGWDKLGNYYASYVNDAANNVTIDTSTDGQILRLSKAVGKDVRPLLHFWGIYPSNATTLSNNIAAAGLTPSLEIYNALLHYKTLVPANNAAFQSFAFSWWGHQPTMAGDWEEREHARQWDTTPLYSAGDQQRSEATNPGEIYNENSANDICNRVQELIDLYFPTGAPADNVAPAVMTLSPIAGAIETSVGANLVMTFTKPVVVKTGNLTLKNLTDNTQSNIVITDASQVSVASAVLTINPAANLLAGKQYAIRIDATAISDAAGNSFAGIADDTTWSFTTQTTNSGLFTWDGTANTWTSAHWNAGGGLVGGPVGDSSRNTALINGGTVTFAASDTFGNALTMASPLITLNSGATLASGGGFNTMWDLTLNGSALLANGGANSPYGAFALKGTVTVGGSAAADISAGTGSFNTVSLGIGIGGSTTFNVADVTASAAADLSISTALNDNSNVASGLIKTGTGTLTLTGANTYSGATAVNAGTLQIGDGTSGHDGSLLTSGITDSGALVYNLYGNQTAGYAISGTGSLNKNGAGTLTLTGANTYSGATTVSAGTLELGGAGTLGGGSYAGDISIAGAFVYSSSAAQTLSGIITGSGSIAKTGTGTLTLTQALNAWPDHLFDGAITVNSGTLQAPNQWWTLNTASSITVNGGILNTGSVSHEIGNLTLNGGTVTSSGLDAGGTPWGNLLLVENSTVHAGGAAVSTLSVQQVNLHGTNGFDASAGSTLNVTSVVVDYGGPAGLNKTSAGTLTLTGANIYTGATTVSAGTLKIDGAGTLGGGSYAGDISIATGGAFVYNSSAAQTLSGVINGSGPITQNGPGTLTITSTLNAWPTSYYDGHVTVNGGTLQMPDIPWALNGITVTVNAGATLTTGTNPSEIHGWALNGGTVNSTTVPVGRGPGNFGNLLLAVDSTVTAGGGAVSTIASDVSLSGRNVFAVGVDSTLHMTGLVVYGPGWHADVATTGITKTGAGTLTLSSAANDYSGATIVTQGTFALGASNVLPNGTNVTLGTATLNAATFTDTAGTLAISGSGTINLGSGAALAFADSHSVAWTGTLTLTGTYVSGSSLRFGTDATGLTSGQLASISKPGGGTVALDASGFLVDAAAGYASWKAVNAPTGTTADDYDGDGVSNGVEYVLGGTKNTKDLSKLPAVFTSGTNLLFTFQRAQASIDGTTSVAIHVGTDLSNWPDSYNVPGTAQANNPGVTVVKDTSVGYDTVTLSVPRAPDAKKFARLKVTPAP